MDDYSLSTAYRTGMVAALAVLLLGLVYAVVLALGFISLGGSDRPIAEPLLSMLELLIIAMTPAMVALMAAIHVWASAPVKALSLSALIFMAVTAALTVCVHFTILVLGRTPQFSSAPWTLLLFSFRWPSVAYALDILAWDLFFPLSMLFAAPAFRGARLVNGVRRLMIVSAVLALGGLSGPLTGDMRLRNIGILGYAGVFPIAAATLAVLFRREEREMRK